MPRLLVDPRFPALLRELRVARDLSQPELARESYTSKSTISELETGRKRPSQAMAAALDKALAANGALAGMVTEEERTRRRPAGPMPTVEVEPGRPMEADDVAHLRVATSQLVALDNAYGGNDTHELAARMFRTASRKLACGAYAPAVEADLQAAVGELGEVAAWLLYDADRQQESRRVNTEAMTISRLAGDRAIELLELANLAMQSVHLRRGREALRVAEHVLAADRLTPRVEGLFQVRRARALAVMGERPRALDALDRARALVGDGATDRDPPWAWWVDAGELAWHAAMLHADLGQHHRAVELFQAGLTERRPASARAYYNDMAHLLDAYTVVGAWSDTEPLVREILPQVDEIGSARTERLLWQAVVRAQRAVVPDSLGDHVRVLADRLSGVR